MVYFWRANTRGSSLSTDEASRFLLIASICSSVNPIPYITLLTFELISDLFVFLLFDIFVDLIIGFGILVFGFLGLFFPLQPFFVFLFNQFDLFTKVFSLFLSSCCRFIYNRSGKGCALKVTLAYVEEILI